MLDPLPTTSEGIRSFITRRPYTEIIDEEEITYSVLPKKQESFVMTHDRFLILKGIEWIGYARELPENTQLPFGHFNKIPNPKSYVRLGEISNIEIETNYLKITHGKE